MDRSAVLSYHLCLLFYYYFDPYYMQDVFLMFLLWYTVSVAYRFSALTHIFQSQLSVSSLSITKQFIHSHGLLHVFHRL